MGESSKSSPSSATDRQLTRQQVADQLGVSVSAVRRMEGKTLHPARDDAGVWRFSVSEVCGHAKSVPASKRPPKRAAASAARVDAEGELAAKVFEALAAGLGIRQIVTRLRVAPAKVRELYAEWHLDLVAGERQRREGEQLKAQSRDQRERIAWMRALGDDV